jgi:hypothetical protein
VEEELPLPTAYQQHSVEPHIVDDCEYLSFDQLLDLDRLEEDRIILPIDDFAPFNGTSNVEDPEVDEEEIEQFRLAGVAFEDNQEFEGAVEKGIKKEDEEIKLEFSRDSTPIPARSPSYHPQTPDYPPTPLRDYSPTPIEQIDWSDEAKAWKRYYTLRLYRPTDRAQLERLEFFQEVYRQTGRIRLDLLLEAEQFQEGLQEAENFINDSVQRANNLYENQLNTVFQSTYPHDPVPPTASTSDPKWFQSPEYQIAAAGIPPTSYRKLAKRGHKLSDRARDGKRRRHRKYAQRKRERARKTPQSD